MAVELSEEVRKDLRDGLLRGLQRALSGNPGNTLSGQPVPEFLAGPAPSNPLGAFQHRSGRAVCDRWARGERGGILPSRDAYLRQLCEPYLGPDMPGAPSTEPPFSGGQCPVLYICEAQRVSNPGFVIQATGSPLLGPITGVSVATLGAGPGGTTTYQATFVGQGGTATAGDQNFEAPPGLIATVRRLDGQPDSCGDPAPEFDSGEPNPTPDPNPGPVGGPTGFPFPDIDITIGPGGDIFVDFGDGEPPEVIDPTDPGGEGGGGGGGFDPSDPGSPGNPEDTGAGGDAEGNAPEGEELVGVLVEVLSTPLEPNTFNNNSSTVYRGIGYVRMGFPGRLGTDVSGGTVISPQFFHAQQRGLTAWAVYANLGFNIRTTPYYREITS